MHSFEIYGKSLVQTNKPTSIHMCVCNAVKLVRDNLRLAQIISTLLAYVLHAFPTSFYIKYIMLLFFC